jgi:hypothetical protein
VFRSDAQDLFAFLAEDFLDSHVRILRTQSPSPSRTHSRCFPNGAVERYSGSRYLP